MPIDLSALYAGSAPNTSQAVSQPASPDRNTAPAAQPATNENPHAVAISWIGILVALILLRLIYEFSE